MPAFGRRLGSADHCRLGQTLRSLVRFSLLALAVMERDYVWIMAWKSVSSDEEYEQMLQFLQEQCDDINAVQRVSDFGS